MSEGMDLAAVRVDVAAIDLLMRDIAQRPVDLSDPDWVAKRRAAPKPVDEAGVAAEAAAALATLLDAYESGDEEMREEVRETFRAHRYFTWAVGLSDEWQSAAEFRRRLILVSARDQHQDPRDELMMIWWLCDHARAQGIDVEPVLREVADMSSRVDHYDFGSMRDLILRGREEHDLR
ncbi:hypothetical protein ACIA5D_15185 [Actinoplanes sp. NPDC051513]|uniref:hypothetical protein n=1 Tax=Actinoplanes sp. NPDC051513 TaxID=3363908 RepID=UPI00379E0B1B